MNTFLAGGEPTAQPSGVCVQRTGNGRRSPDAPNLTTAPQADERPTPEEDAAKADTSKESRPQEKELPRVTSPVPPFEGE